MAGSRHSAADVALIKACRKAVMDHASMTAQHAEAMKTMFADLGDDLQDYEQVDSRAAETDAVRSVTPKAIKAIDTLTALQEIFAATVTFWYKAHAAHWNLEGEDFPQYHAFFGEMYEAAFAAIDPTAEFIRTLRVKAPADLYQVLSLVPRDPMSAMYTLPDMILSLYVDNMYMCDALRAGIFYSGAAGEFGIQNYLQDRLAYHQKLQWMLQAIMTPAPELPEAEEPGEMEPAEAEPSEPVTETKSLTPEAERLANQLLYILGGKQ